MRPYLAGASALAIGLCPAVSHAQIAEDLGGVWIDGTLSFGFRVDEGDPEFRTGFDLGVSTATRTQFLKFSGDFGLTVPLDEIEAADFTDPAYRLEYQRNNGQSVISAVASFQTRDVDGLVLDPDADPDDFDELDLIEDDGTRDTTRLALGLQWGLQDPFGGTLGYNVTQVEYSGTNDPDLIDSTDTRVSGSLRFDVDPTLRFTLQGSQRLEEEEDETESRRAGLGVVWQMTPILGFDGQLGWSRTTRTVPNTAIRTERTGAEFDFAFTLDRPNGNWRLGYDRALSVNGTQATVRLSRSLDLPGGASLATSIGATELPSGDVYAIGSLDYARETRRGNLGFSASRRAAVNNRDDAVERTRFSAVYSEDLASGANWSIRGTYIESDYSNPAESDLTVLQTSVRYSVPLTRDWDLSSGLTFRETREEGRDAEQRSTFFVNVERSFSLRP